MSLARTLRPAMRTAPRSVAAPVPMARSYAAPTPGAHPPAEQSGSRKTGTTQMLAGSVLVLAVSAGIFMSLGRDSKKATVGVGSEGANKLQGSKFRAAKALENGTTSGHEGVLGKSGSPASVDRAAEAIRERAADAKDSVKAKFSEAKDKTEGLRDRAAGLKREAEDTIEATQRKATDLKNEAERRI